MLNIGRLNIVSLTLGALLLGTASVSRAQCPSTCTQSTEHWTFPNTSGSADVVYLGFLPGYWNGSLQWAPALCEGTTAYLPSNLATLFSTAQLRADSSFCLGGGNDDAHIIPAGETKACGSVVLYGVGDNGYELTISGENGNDSMWSIYIASWYTGDLNLCGGSGADELHPGSGSDYVHGAGDNDNILNSSGYDNIRGGTGNDVLHHTTTDAMDLVRGEDGSDCVEVALGYYAAGSSCGDGDDYYDIEGDSLGGTCETGVGTCAWSP